LTILFALLAALCNALNVTTQHIASTSDPERSKGWRLVVYLFRSPLWLLGWVALAGAFLFQALALHRGEMSVVQPLLVTELVFVLVLRRVWIHQAIRAITWWSAAVTCVMLALFVAMSEPQGGNAVPSSHAWVSATVATVAAAAVLALFGMRGSPRRRAALLGSSTAIMWALVATFIKTTTETLSQFGFAGMFLHWPVYALAGAGIAAEVLNQAALHVGPLSVSQPFLVIVDPIVSIALSVWVFEEYFTPNAAKIALAVLGFVGMCAGVVVLIRTAPATMGVAPSPAGTKA
jgi:drug/metabolite transporter (DMT)-like permease